LVEFSQILLFFFRIYQKPMKPLRSGFPPSAEFSNTAHDMASCHLGLIRFKPHRTWWQLRSVSLPRWTWWGPGELVSEVVRKQFSALFQGPLAPKSIAALRAATRSGDAEVFRVAAALAMDKLVAQVETVVA
jgi:hypothetical protein